MTRRPPGTVASTIGPAGRPRMEDVARIAGVSLVTVSRAINQPEKLAPDTRALVQATIDRLGYVPNLTAGSLASRRSRIVAAIVPTLASSIFSDTLDGLSQTLAAAGYQLLVGQTHFRREDEAHLIDAFVGRRVDGVVWIHSGAPEEAGVAADADADPVAARLAAAAIPVVEAWDLVADPIDMVVGFSNREAGAAAARHLIERGYRRLAFIGSEGGRSAARFAGFCAAAQASGLVKPLFEPLSPLGSMPEAAASFGVLRTRDPQLRAVLCSNDMLAAGVLFECQRLGLAVPGQMAVIGFADLPIAAAVVPTLTTVHVPSHEIGRRAGELLLARMRDLPVAASRIDVGYRVVARQST